MSPKYIILFSLIFVQVCANYKVLKLKEIRPLVKDFCDNEGQVLCETCVLYNNSIYKIYYKALRNLGKLERNSTVITDNLEYIGNHVQPLKDLVERMIAKCDVDGADTAFRAFVLAPLETLSIVAKQKPYLL